MRGNLCTQTAALQSCVRTADLTHKHASVLTRRPHTAPHFAPSPPRYYTPSDLSLFQTNNNLTVTPIARQIGFNNASKPGVEAQLDTQYLTGVADNVRTEVWYTAGARPGGNEPFLNWLMNVTAATKPLPNVFSISYQDYEDTVAAAFMTRVSTEFAKLGALGITIVTGSGDWGTGCAKDGKYVENMNMTTRLYCMPVWSLHLIL